VHNEENDLTDADAGSIVHTAITCLGLEYMYVILMILMKLHNTSELQLVNAAQIATVPWIQYVSKFVGIDEWLTSL